MVRAALAFAWGVASVGPLRPVAAWTIALIDVGRGIDEFEWVVRGPTKIERCAS